MIDIIKKQKYENIIKLENRDDKEGILQEIEHYTHTLINIKYQEKENMISMTDKDKQKLIDELKKDFPDLAK
jgi:23S rRNA A1618 N6-methylase RlmF